MVAVQKGRWVPRKVQTKAAQGPLTQLDMRLVASGSDTTGHFTISTAREVEHFELTSGDAACMEATDGAFILNLLPVTAGSSRTAKRRFRRQRCRQRSRLLTQHPLLHPAEAREW